MSINAEVAARIQSQGLELTNRVVAVNSVSGAPSEWIGGQSGETKVATIFQDFFLSNGADAFLQEVPHPYGPEHPPRHNVFAVLPGRSKKTIVISGHIDTVPLNQPEQLDTAGETDRIAALNGLDPSAIIGGRGALDMKGPLAAAAVTIIEAQKAGIFDGTIVFGGYADEETGSAGAIVALEQLARLQDEQGLQITGIVDVDFTSPEFVGDNEHPVYEGTIGKFCPYWVVRTGSTHVGSPHRSLNAQTVVDRINLAIGNNCNFSDQSGDSVTPPPTVLRSQTDRTDYSVQTPPKASAYANWFTIGGTSDDVLAGISDVMTQSFTESVEENRRLIAAKVKRNELPAGHSENIPQPQVFTFEQLVAELRSNGIEQRYIDAVINGTSPNIDSRERSIIITHQLIDLLDNPGQNVAVVGFAPPFYPYRRPRESAFSSAVVQAAAQAGENGGFKTAVKRFFPYICDLSWFGLEPEVETDLPRIQANMPLWEQPGGYAIPAEAMKKLNVEVVNSGGRGQDAHGPNEYAFIDSTYIHNPAILWEILVKMNETL